MLSRRSPCARFSDRRARPPLLVACVVVAACLLAATVIGCRPKSTERARVAVSIFPVYDLVRRVAGPDADVVLVLPPGRSPQGFVPGDAEAAVASNVKLGVLVGLGLDAWMGSVVTARSPKARLLKVGDRVPTLTLPRATTGGSGAGGEHEGDEASIDPHVWLDPQRARLIVKAIGEELSRVDARHAGAYRQRTSEVDASLDALDKEVEATLARFHDRTIVTAHASFGYLAERYHLEVAGPVEPAPGGAPRAERIAELTALVRARKAALFREPQREAPVTEGVAKAAGVPTFVLDPLGGTAGADSYEALLRLDVAALVRALE